VIRGLRLRPYVAYDGIAKVYSALGDHDRALAALDTALSYRAVGLIVLGADPVYDEIRGERRFGEILDSVHVRDMRRPRWLAAGRGRHLRGGEPVCPVPQYFTSNLPELTRRSAGNAPSCAARVNSNVPAMWPRAAVVSVTLPAPPCVRLANHDCDPMTRPANTGVVEPTVCLPGPWSTGMAITSLRVASEP
jgi:hypothetical protein